MRFAPPPSLRIADGSGGLNQIRVRSYNERLIMSLLLQNNGMSRMQMGKISGLSAQTISVIVRGLERDGLISRGEAQSGRVGPPTIPMSLNPDGVFSVGISLYRHGIDVVLIDFIGGVRHFSHLNYEHLVLDDVKSSLLSMIAEALDVLDASVADRVAGIGVSIPADVQQWSEELARFDFEQFLQSETGYEIYIQNDVTAAAGAESMFGAAVSLDNYLFCFLGDGDDYRLVLDHQIHAGIATSHQDRSSVGLTALQELCMQHNQAVDTLLRRDGTWDNLEPSLQLWIKACADRLCHSLLNLRQFVSIDQMIVTGLLPSEVSARIVDEVCSILSTKPGSDFERIEVVQGEIGPKVSAVGAARLPFQSRFVGHHVQSLANEQVI
ncbi:MAG: ROK family transcriptional regulator [Hyphomicrobiales bacterium]